MNAEEIRPVVDAWQHQYADLGTKPNIGYVQVFENRGSMMGASNPHPHGQIWASENLPQEIITENASQKDYWNEHGCSLLADYLDVELKIGERIVYQNDGFVVLVPFWAVWPFETMIVSRRHLTQMTDFNEAALSGLADALHQLTVRYDNIFRTSFPYSAGFHQQPVTDGDGNTGIGTLISIRRCCGRPRYASSSLATRCWARRSATSRRNRRQNASVRRARPTTDMRRLPQHLEHNATRE